MPISATDEIPPATNVAVSVDEALLAVMERPDPNERHNQQHQQHEQHHHHHNQHVQHHREMANLSIRPSTSVASGSQTNTTQQMANTSTSRPNEGTCDTNIIS